MPRSEKSPHFLITAIRPSRIRVRLFKEYFDAADVEVFIRSLRNSVVESYRMPADRYSDEDVTVLEGQEEVAQQTKPFWKSKSEPTFSPKRRRRSHGPTDLTGQHFGTLEVLGFGGIKNRIYYWRCRCTVCGEEKLAASVNLKASKSKCKCQYGKKGRPKNGLSGSGIRRDSEDTKSIDDYRTENDDFGREIDEGTENE
jgi:hypothetical protein